MTALPPPKHRWLSTEDGSLTLFSEEFQEGCHSLSGARSETLLHYVQGCQVLERARSVPDFTVLEVGFGLGLGLLTTAEALAAHALPWNFISLELDRDLVQWFADQGRLENPTWKGNVLEARLGSCSLAVITGDARRSLPDFLKTRQVIWHAVYQDAFSPRRNPALWTKEWFLLLKAHAHPKAVMSTYSASTAVRKSMLEAGWKIIKGEKFGPKRSSTRARLTGDSDQEILQHLASCPAPALTDDNLEEFLRKSSL